MKFFGRKSAGRGSLRPALLRSWSSGWSSWASGGDIPRSYEDRVREGYVNNPVAQRAVRLVAEGVGSAPISASDPAIVSLLNAKSAGQGLTVNGAARTWTYDGVGAATTATVTLTETLASATNSPRASTVAVTIAAASGPANNMFAMFGDSRTQQGHPGIPADPNLGGYSAIGIQGALLSKVGGLISFDPENSMYGRSGAACIDSAAVPRGSTAGSATPSTAASAAVGADVCAASAAQSVIFLLGTNEAGSVNLAIGGTSWNAVISILNRFNGKYRVYILNEFPRGKTSAGALNNDLVLADAGRHYQDSAPDVLARSGRQVARAVRAVLSEE